MEKTSHNYWYNKKSVKTRGSGRHIFLDTESILFVVYSNILAAYHRKNDVGDILIVWTRKGIILNIAYYQKTQLNNNVNVAPCSS